MASGAVEGDARGGAAMGREKKMTISELAREFGIAPSAIRYYEEVGLLSPHRETPKSQRLYNDRDRARLKLILRGKRFGYSLAELADILELYEVDPTQEKQIVRTLEYGFRHIREIDERIEELMEIRGEMLEFAAAFLAILEERESAGAETRAFVAMARRVLDELQGRGFAAGAGTGKSGKPREEGVTRAKDEKRNRKEPPRKRGSAAKSAREG